MYYVECIVISFSTINLILDRLYKSSLTYVFLFLYQRYTETDKLPNRAYTAYNLYRRIKYTYSVHVHFGFVTYVRRACGRYTCYVIVPIGMHYVMMTNRNRSIIFFTVCIHAHRFDKYNNGRVKYSIDRIRMHGNPDDLYTTHSIDYT